jgi:hypothetical protein
MKKYTNNILFFLISLFSIVSYAHATADITTALKGTTTNSATITIKNNAQAGFNTADGSILGLAYIKIKATNTATTVVESFVPETNFSGGQSKDLVVIGLTPNTTYSMEIEARDQTGASPIKKMMTVKTKASAQQTLSKLPLYVQFVPTKTVMTANGITVTLKNTGTKSFTAVVVVKNAVTGVEVGRDSILIGAGLETLRLFGSLTPATTYNLTLSGTEVGSNRVYETISYNGLLTKASPVVIPAGSAASPAAAPASSAPTTASGQCGDGKDNQIGDGKDYGYGVGNGDHKADHYGVDTLVNGKGDGIIDVEPDPSCFSPTATVEKGDDVVSSIIPCTDKCTFTDVFRLLNNFMKFFFTALLIPIFVIIVMYAGYKYLMAGANGGAKADVKKMLGNIVKGIILMLCAWLIVHTIMTTLLNENFKQSGVEFLSQ